MRQKKIFTIKDIIQKEEDIKWILITYSQLKIIIDKLLESQIRQRNLEQAIILLETKIEEIQKNNNLGKKVYSSFSPSLHLGGARLF